jgi:hypothetical protein
LNRLTPRNVKRSAIAILIAALCVTPVALAGPNTPGAAPHPHVSIRPAIVRPSIHPHIRVPSLGRHVARSLRKKHNTHAQMRWTGSWSTEIVTSRRNIHLRAAKTRVRHPAGAFAARDGRRDQ